MRLHRQAYLRFYGRPRILGHLAVESLTNRQVISASVRSLRRLFRRTPVDARTPLYLREASV